MREFNYKRAYREQALPAFKNLNGKQHEAHALLIPLIKDLQQGKDLNIPLTPDMINILNPLSCQEIAELSRCSYFVGHWHPAKEEKPFDNSKGESWKVANVCDQVLRTRFIAYSNNDSPLQPLQLPHNIQIHEGKFRVTYSNRNCWIWEEFGLATEKNLEIFKTCALSFREDTLEKHAKTLKALCNDLWSDCYDHKEGTEYDNEEIPELLKREIPELVSEVLSCQYINHQPHPFMITNKHIQNSKGMYLDPDSAPCGFKAGIYDHCCQLSYAKHKSDRVIFIRPVGELNNENKQLHSDLLMCKNVLESLGIKIDGFAFVKGE